MLRILMLVLALGVVTGCANGVYAPASSIHHNMSESETVHGRGVSTQKWWDALPRKDWALYERVLTHHNWFEIYQILPSIYAIYEPHQFEEVISFLVVGEQKALLFDTGLGIARIRPIVAQLTDLEILVVNSHSHYDHVGGNFEFETIKGIDHSFSVNNARGKSLEMVSEFVQGDWMAKPVPEGIDVSDYKIQPYAVTGYLEDGMLIDLGGRQLEVVKTPGHTPDSLCLIDRQNRLLFTGDTFYLAPLYAHMEEASFADYRNSVNRLADLAPKVDLLLTAHNVPIADSDYLLKLKEAFHAIDNGGVAFIETDGAHEYQFDGFSIIAPKQVAIKP